MRGATMLLAAALAAGARRLAPRPPCARVAVARMHLDASIAGGSKRSARRKRAAASGQRGPLIDRRTSGGGVAAKDASPLMAALRQCVRERQPLKAYELYQPSLWANATASQEAYPPILRALLKMQRVDLALELHHSHTRRHPELIDANTSSVLFARLLKRGTDQASDGLIQARELLSQLDDFSSKSSSPSGYNLRMAISHTMLPALAFELIRRGEIASAELAVHRTVQETLDSQEAAPPLEKLKELMREMGKARSFTGVYSCLDIMQAAGITPDAEMLQIMVDALARRVWLLPARACFAYASSRREGVPYAPRTADLLLPIVIMCPFPQVSFVKGGVSVETLPTNGLKEVAFVGRSNVGKSSLVNMVLGRRAIAYTSKTPGKTQQYNYFLINEGMDADSGAFHLVDMPGLGYAKVPAPARKRWLDFLGSYMSTRQELKLVVHLVDSQVGVQETDRAIMHMVGDAVAARDVHRWTDSEREGESEQLDQIRYAVILTKADKNDGKVKREVLHQVRETFLSAGCPEDSPIVPTSSKSKYGRDGVWRLFRDIMIPSEQGSRE